MTNKEFATALHNLADVYELHADIPQPYAGTLGQWYAFVEPKDIPAVVHAFGELDKSTDSNGSYFNLTPKLGELLFHFTVRRDRVCRKIVTGTRTVPEQVIAATEARTIPTHEEEIVEWECEPLLATKKQEDKAVEVTL